MSNHYDRWNDKDSIEKFSNKRIDQFFDSELYFIDKIIDEVESVLDIGCASGKFYDLLQDKKNNTLEYTGIDISEESIEIARSNYPDLEFFCANSLEFKSNARFDLVNATGVFQHEPKFMELLMNMILWSNKYILFDLKFGNVDSHIIDQSLSCAGTKSNPLYYILLNYEKIIQQFNKIKGISSVEIYGYEIEVNENVIVPKEYYPVFSASVLMKKDKSNELGNNINILSNIKK